MSETWLSSEHNDCDFFPVALNIYRADQLYVPGVVECGGGILFGVSRVIQSYRRRDLELLSECVWLEIVLLGSKNLLIVIIILLR